MIYPHIEIIRLEDNFDYGVFGVLMINGEIFCVTLEPYEWQNQKSISCIPAGQYECVRIVSPKFGTTYEIINVPNRSDILFHAGNVLQDTEGCIIVAEKFGKLRENRAVLNSGSTFTGFLNLMHPYEKFKLTIKESWA